MPREFSELTVYNNVAMGKLSNLVIYASHNCDKQAYEEVIDTIIKYLEREKDNYEVNKNR